MLISNVLDFYSLMLCWTTDFKNKSNRVSVLFFVIFQFSKDVTFYTRQNDLQPIKFASDTNRTINLGIVVWWNVYSMALFTGLWALEISNWNIERISIRGIQVQYNICELYLTTDLMVKLIRFALLRIEFIVDKTIVITF